jgi:CIC family chloride channel protein
VAAAICLLMIVFTEGQALLFGVVLLAALTVFYYLRRPVTRMLAEGVKTIEPNRDRILVPVANPQTAEGLARLAAILAQRAADTSVAILGVIPVKRQILPQVAHEFLTRIGRERRLLLERVIQNMDDYNVPFSTRVSAATDIGQEVLREARAYGHDKLILMGWPGPLDAPSLMGNPVSQVLEHAHTNVAVFLNRGMPPLRHILVPVGGATHSLLALRLAYELGEQEKAKITALRCFCDAETGDIQDELMLLREMIETELGDVPPTMNTKVVAAPSVAEGIFQEIAQSHYDLVVMGSAMARSIQADLFGSLTDRIAAEIPCSVLLVRRYEPAVIGWLRRRVKQIMKD